MRHLFLLLTLSLTSVTAFAQSCEDNARMLCAGNKVIHNNTVRTVEAVDDTNRVILAEDSSYYRSFTTKEQVAKTVRCLGDLCRKDKVLKDNTIRTVELIGVNGQVVLAEDSSYYRSFSNLQAISKLVSCFGKYCEGDEVLKDNTTREIEAVDQRGRVILKEDSHYYRSFVTANQISMLRECTRYGSEHRGNGGRH
jgi:hypothetical protein